MKSMGHTLAGRRGPHGWYLTLAPPAPPPIRLSPLRDQVFRPGMGRGVLVATLLWLFVWQHWPGLPPIVLVAGVLGFVSLWQVVAELRAVRAVAALWVLDAVLALVLVWLGMRS